MVFTDLSATKSVYTWSTGRFASPLKVKSHKSNHFLGGLPYKKGRDARREISIEPLKGSNPDVT